MDAKVILAVLGACALVVSGCEVPASGPETRNEQRAPVQPQEPPLVVDDHPQLARGATEDPVEQRVLEWVERIDDPGRRLGRTAQPGPGPDNPDPDYVAARHPASISQDVPLSANPPARIPPSDQPEDVGTPAQATTEETRDTVAELPPTEEPAVISPPTLTGVSVRGEATVDLAAPTAQGPGSGVNSPASAANAPLSLRQFLSQWRCEAHEGSFQEQLDARILHLVAGDYERAREPLALVSHEQQEMATRLIEALIAIRETHLGDLGRGAPAVLREVEQLMGQLRHFSDLSIPTIAICREVRGFGQYEPIDPPRFLAGMPGEFVVYCEVRDFAAEQANDGLYYTRFDMRTTLLTAAGDTVLEIKDTDIIDRCRNRRQDCFIPRLVRLPASLSPGEYVVKITLVDKVGEKVAESRAALRVAAGS
ncbi:MAG: hypothetical protein KKB50_06550 [Planctomycetes bacterium]|nr:hypothetical protein [Planctomycetota bacterium]